MALQVYYENDTIEEYNIPLDVSQWVTIRQLLRHVAYIVVTGDELEAIRAKFTATSIFDSTRIVLHYPTIPVPQGDTAYWYGDIAKTIILNL